MLPEEITIEDTIWRKVKERDYTLVAVYTTGSHFLRMGKKEILQPEYELQKLLVSNNFPLPNPTKTGEYEEFWYFVEPSFGEKLYTWKFAEEYTTTGQITEQTFLEFLSVCKNLTRAQLQFTTPPNEDSLQRGVHYEVMKEELPHAAEKIQLAYERAMKKLSALPWSTAHGDFTSHNILSGGAIDIGAHCTAPVGYDAVTAICHIENFPFGEAHEISRAYSFSKKQIYEYMKEMDALFTAHNVPPLSEFLADFIFLRILWTAARMDHLPKLQKWRYGYFYTILEKYLNGEDLSLPHANSSLDNFS